MKNLHIVNSDKFVLPYIKFINKYFDKDEHIFLVVQKNINDEFEVKYSNVNYVLDKTINFKMVRKMYQSKNIYLHGLFNGKIVTMLFLNPILLKKCNWIIWGGDLYRYQSPIRTFKGKVYEFMRKVVIRHMGRVLPLVKGDYELAERWYGIKGKCKVTKYINMERNNYIYSLLQKRQNEHKTINVQIGNSASNRNNHIEVFEILKKFKKENIKIYCPLSYGDKENAEKVKKVGKRIFGDKFVPMESFLEIKEYLDHMYSIDIGIFNNDRQQGFGNVNELLFLKKKVFINNTNTLWDYYKSLGIEINAVKEIKNLSFDKFCEVTKQIREKNHNIIKHRFSNDKTKYIWDEIFKN